MLNGCDWTGLSGMLSGNPFRKNGYMDDFHSRLLGGDSDLFREIGSAVAAVGASLRW